ECTQDAFMAAWRTARTFDSGRAQPSTWLCAIARNRALDALRGQSRRPTPQEEVQPIGAAPDTADVVADADAAVRVGEAMARLPQEQLDVLQLGYFDGLSQSEIADRLGLPLGTVKSRMRLALGRMRDVARDLGLEA
ncbi:MAG: RNA polymerase sigma factor, partial [Miltoncostaeaceae bacterium]